MKQEAYEQTYNLLEKTSLKNESEEAVVLMTNALFITTVQQAPELAVLHEQINEKPTDLTALF